MCELFALSSAAPTTVSLSLHRFARHGGEQGPHKDGWGVAVYRGRDAFILREPQPASESALVAFIEKHLRPGTLFLSHIRQATFGKHILSNTHPFSRELNGRLHVFAHNGHLGDFHNNPALRAKRFRPIGDTDSEQAFCNLLDRMTPIWCDAGDDLPPLQSRLDVVREFAAVLRPLGPANFLYSDGDVLFAHAHQRRQKNRLFAPPGLHMLQRSCREPAHDPQIQGLTISSTPQLVTILASVPLTDEPWRPLGEGEVVAVKDGAQLTGAD